MFPVALQPILVKLRSISGIDFCFAYLDDVSLGGEDQAVQEAVDLLFREAAAIGLHLKLSKCNRVPTAGSRTQTDLSHFSGDIQRVGDAC